MGERIGVFGGTFDPPHNGHIVAALAARHQLDLDRVLMVVAGDPWQKRGTVEANAATRFDLLRAACIDVEGLEPCDVEVSREGATYTIDTIEALAAPDRAIVVILGADAVAGLDSWHRAADLAAAVEIAAVERTADAGSRGWERPSARWRITDVAMPHLEITSTAIRAACRAGAPIDGLTPTAVVRLVRERRLYTRHDDRDVGA